MSILERVEDALIRRSKESKLDSSVQSLIVCNLVVIVWAVIEKWSIFTLMWIYWTQSVSIGIFCFIRMLTLKKFSTKNFQGGGSGKPLAATTLTKIHTSIFFLFHYGGFHLAYAAFLVAPGKSAEPVPVVLAGTLFFVNQFFSFVYNRERHGLRRLNIGKLMFFPYMRIIPMHVTIFAAQLLREKYDVALDGRLTLALFLLLKTVADVVMYIKQLRGFADWPSRKLDDAGPLVQALTGKDRHRKFAEKIHIQMKKAYVSKHVYQIADPKDFPHLNLRYYRKKAKELRSQGFTMLGDIEDVTLSQIHPQFRTFIRCLVSQDGTIEAGIYYLSSKETPKMLRLLDSTLSAKIIILKTELSNGCFLLTTNATETFSTAPRIFVQYSPSDTCVIDLLDTHERRIEEYKAQKPEIHAISVCSLQKAIDSANRQNMILAAYGKAIPGILWEINKIAERDYRGITEEDVVYELRKPRDSQGDHERHR
jgi:hypothetical protein